MKIINYVYISGLGAIGSVYAELLFESNPDCVKVIASKERIDRYVKNGININDKVFPFNFIEPGIKNEPADLILIAVKQHHLAQTIQDIRSFVGLDTIILSLLNGITSEEIIGKEFGMEKLLYSFVVGTDAVRKGRNTKFSNTGKIVFGEKNNVTYSAKVNLVKELFDRVKIPYQIPEDMMGELWWKFMLNVGINQVSAILRDPYGVFHKVGEACELMEMASREVLQLSKKAGIELREDDINSYIKIIQSAFTSG